MSLTDGDLFTKENNAWDPTILYLKDEATGAWKRQIVAMEVGGNNAEPNSIAVTAPSNNTTITTPTFTIVADAVNATDVQFYLDGTIDLGEPETTNNRTWTIQRRLTGDISNGAHTITAVARFQNGALLTSAAVNITMNAPPPDPGDNGDETELITLLYPNSALALPTWSGSAAKPKAEVQQALIDAVNSPVLKVEFSIGSPVDRGYSAATDLDNNIWEQTTGFNTDQYMGTLAEAGSQAIYDQLRFNQWFDIRAKVTFINGQVRYSPYCRAFSTNDSFVGTNPTWNPNKAWKADTTTTVKALWTSYQKTQTTGPNAGKVYQQNGNTYGKELQAMQIVPDPDASNTYGHVAFPTNVLLIDVPNEYAANTANYKSPISGATYGAGGDQPNSGVRGQLSTPVLAQEGDMYYYGNAFRLSPTFPTPTGTHISAMQVYPAANNEYDWSLMWMLDMHEKLSEHKDAKSNTLQLWGGRGSRYERAKLFECPMYRGKWMSWVWGFGWSKDGRKAWMEIYTAQPGVNGGNLTQHKFPNGSGRLYTVTLPKLNDGASIHSHLYRAGKKADGSWSWPSPNIVKAHFYGMAIGPTVASVNPNTFNTLITYA